MSWLAIAVDDGPWGKVEDTPPSRVLPRLGRRRPADPLAAVQSLLYCPLPREREPIQFWQANLCATHRVRCHPGGGPRQTSVPCSHCFMGKHGARRDRDVWGCWVRHLGAGSALGCFPPTGVRPANDLRNLGFRPLLGQRVAAHLHMMSLPLRFLMRCGFVGRLLHRRDPSPLLVSPQLPTRRAVLCAGASCFQMAAE